MILYRFNELHYYNIFILSYQASATQTEGYMTPFFYFTYRRVLFIRFNHCTIAVCLVHQQLDKLPSIMSYLSVLIYTHYVTWSPPFTIISPFKHFVLTIAQIKIMKISRRCVIPYKNGQLVCTYKDTELDAVITQNSAFLWGSNDPSAFAMPVNCGYTMNGAITCKPRSMGLNVTVDV